MPRAKPEPPDPLVVFYTIPQVARFLGNTSEDHVYRLIASGVLRARDCRVPGSRQPKTRVRSDDLLAYMDATPEVGAAVRTA